MSNSTDTLAKYVGQRVQVLSPIEGYEAVRIRTQGAHNEILKLIYYDVYPKDGKPVYDDSLLQASERKILYHQEREKLQHEKRNDNFRYIEIVQIPHGFNLEKVLFYDSIYRENCKVLSELGRTRPEFASLRMSEVVFPSAFIVIDKSFLYIAFQTKNPDSGSYTYPFLGLMIENPDSQVVRDMVRLFHRIEANSKLVVGIDTKGIADVET
jgi:hypothetical protein